MVAELIGGPMDGHVISVDPSIRVLEFPSLRVPPMAMDPGSMSCPPSVLVHAYRLRGGFSGGPPCYDYAGSRTTD